MPTLTPNYGFQKPLVNNATDADLWGGQLNSNWDDIDTLLKTVQDDTSPTGTIIMYGTDTPPTGYLECDGSEIDRTTYADLFAVIGTTWGAGDGSTTFDLPDFRGEFLRGWDNGRGIDSGRAFATDQDFAIENITGSFSVTGSFSGVSADGVFDIAATSLNSTDGFSNNGRTVDFDASTVVNTANETRPRNVSILYCIKT